MIEKLPRREREIFEILCAAGEASAAEVGRRMADPPSHSAVRTMLSRLEKRGLVQHRTVDQTYIYSSVQQPAKVRKSALQQVRPHLLRRVRGRRRDRVARAFAKAHPG